MLFDLRSKSRRNTVRVVYVILALIMLSGLLLVGVGTGNNNGGILNAFSNGSSNSGQDSAIEQQTKAAVKLTQTHPDSAKDWAGLVQARWSAAGNGSNYNTTTDTYTASGKKQLNAALTAWQRYLTLTNGKPNVDTSLLVGRIYQALENWSSATGAWEYVIQAGPASALKGYECLALNAFAAKQTSKAELAAAAATKLLPKVDQAEWTSTVTSAKSSATDAAGFVTDDC